MDCYARRIDGELIVLLILAAIAFTVTALIIFAVVRTAWRIWRGDQEFEPGGSMGRQWFGRYAEDSKKREDANLS